MIRAHRIQIGDTPRRTKNESRTAIYGRRSCKRRDTTSWKSFAPGIVRNLDHPGSNASLRLQDEDGRIFFEDAGVWRDNPEYQRFMFESSMPAVAALLTGVNQLRIFFDNLFVKDPGLNAPTPWHQDLPYTPMEGELCNLWIALDTVPRENSLECIAGSHRWGRSFRPVTFTPAPKEKVGFNTVEPQPDIEKLREDYSILGWSLKPGDTIAFDGMTLHGAPANGTTKRRHAFVARYAADGAIYTPRGPDEYPQFPDCGLVAGDRLSGHQFPLALGDDTVRLTS